MLVLSLGFLLILSLGDMSFSFFRMSLTRDSISRMSLTRKARMGYRHLFVFFVCGLSFSNAMTCPRI